MKELAPLAARLRKGEAVDISDSIASKNEELFVCIMCLPTYDIGGTGGIGARCTSIVESGARVQPDNRVTLIN